MMQWLSFEASAPLIGTHPRNTFTESCLFLQGEYASARAEYEAALQLDPDNPVVAENLQKLERAAAKVGGASKKL